MDYERDRGDHEDDNSLPRRPYSPSIRTYRSLSPTDSRCSYGRESQDYISRYDDTDADFIPPLSPTNKRRDCKNRALLSMHNEDDQSEDNHYGNNKTNHRNKNMVNRKNTGGRYKKSSNMYSK